MLVKLQSCGYIVIILIHQTHKTLLMLVLTMK